MADPACLHHIWGPLDHKEFSAAREVFTVGASCLCQNVPLASCKASPLRFGSHFDSGGGGEGWSRRGMGINQQVESPGARRAPRKE
jgi:hypothetical protein